MQEFTSAIEEGGRSPLEVFTEIVDRELVTRHDVPSAVVAAGGVIQSVRDSEERGCSHETRSGTCRIEQISVVVHADAPPGDVSRSVLETLAQAAVGHLDATDPQWGIRQDLIRASRKARRCIPDGAIRSPYLPDATGEQVRAELDSAVRAAIGALTPHGDG